MMSRERRASTMEKEHGGDTCAYCGGDKLITDALIEDTGEGSGGKLRTRVGLKHPDALLFVGPIRAELRANICCTCGRVDLVVTQPEKLWEEYQSAPGQKRP